MKILGDTALESSNEIIDQLIELPSSFPEIIQTNAVFSFNEFQR